MTALSRRLLRLEARFAQPDDPEDRRRAALLQERIRRWAEANGETYVPMPRQDVRGMSIVEILRQGYKRNDAASGTVSK